SVLHLFLFFFFFQAEDGIRDATVTGVQTCALPISDAYRHASDSQPTFRLARFNLGRMLIALGQNDQAIAELGKLTEPRDAETPRYLFALATAHVRAGHKDEGIKWATEARRLALEYGQGELAAAIARELASLR